MRSYEYNAMCRDLDLIEYSREELIERYEAGLFLTYQQHKDAERAIHFRNLRAKEAE